MGKKKRMTPQDDAKFAKLVFDWYAEAKLLKKAQKSGKASSLLEKRVQRKFRHTEQALEQFE